ncbi:hypothetical protein GYMLUDRAFT_41218 [Collybiopsis luxurians FD-317 M1]|uniref:SAPS-domain-containing protein n=1 Tax=Collybiopsis luxurians FD-317 M1 TaxID=944289 RepID=A0A0D0CJG9_9AGAR|nr:hypothetical protein GYMLUDRAFT_41218 [Collybiopsis luxurians FD-317 M1]
MFWRFGFHAASSIDALLDKDDQSLLTLDSLLDEDDLLQECKAQNTRLVDYFQRVDVLGRLLGWVSGEVGKALEEEEERQEQRGIGIGNTANRFRYPYIATEVLCSEIWSIVETCVSTHPDELLVPFWNFILDKSPQDLKFSPTKSTTHAAAHFAKVNAVFLAKKPTEMLAFIQKQPDIVGRILRHIDNPSFVDLLVRIIQLDEYGYKYDDAIEPLEWLSSEKLISRLIDMLSPAYPPDIHQVVSDLIKGIISMATPSPGAPHAPGASGSLNSASDGGGAGSGVSSNQFARELAMEDSISKLVVYILQDFSTSSPEISDENSASHFESACSSAIHAMGVLTELIRKNNSDYFEPYLFHTLRNRLIGVQQNMMQQGSDSKSDGRESRDTLERAMREMVDRMGVVNLGFILNILCDSGRLDRLVGFLRNPRSLQREGTRPGSVPAPALTFERFRITELLAELLHCSNMALLNRPLRYQHLYDAEGRLQGGLGGLEELARVISIASSDEDGHDQRRGAEGDDNMDADIEPALELPITSASSASTSSSLLDSDEDEDMSSSSEDDSMDMEEIAMYDEPTMQSAAAEPPPHSPEVDMNVLNTAQSSPSITTETPPMDANSGTEPRSQSRRSSRRSTLPANSVNLEAEILVVGERLKRRFLELNVLGCLLDLFFEFPWNNFLHNAVYDIFHQILTGSVDNRSQNREENTKNPNENVEGRKGYNRELILSLFRDAKLMHRIVEGQMRNDEESAKPRTPRLGYMGHLTLISEDVLTALDRYPESLREEILQYAPKGSETGHGSWDEYVTGRYRETKVRDTRLLGGGKPAMGLGGAGAGKWKVDEEEMSGVATVATPAPKSEVNSSGGDEMQGEFRRATSNKPKPRREASADFGVAPTSMDDEDDFDSGHSLRRFGYDDDDGDEEGGWLSQSSSFSTISERRPLGVSGFDDVFDPGATSHSHAREREVDLRDPFSDEDFGPFTAPGASGSSGQADSEDPFSSFSSSFSDDMALENLDDSAFDDNFGDFGEFGEFQSGGAAGANAADSSEQTENPRIHTATGDQNPPSDGELTPTAGSWISDLSAPEGDGDGDSLGSISSSIDSIGSAEAEGTGLGSDRDGTSERSPNLSTNSGKDVKEKGKD